MINSLTNVQGPIPLGTQQAKKSLPCAIYNYYHLWFVRRYVYYSVFPECMCIISWVPWVLTNTNKIKKTHTHTQEKTTEGMMDFG